MQRSAVTAQMLGLICFLDARYASDHLAQFLIICQWGAAGVGALTARVGTVVASLKTQHMAEGLIRGRSADDSKAQEFLHFSPPNSDDLQW